MMKSAKAKGKKLDRTKVKKATELHRKSLAQAKKAAIALGWTESTVSEVANLEWRRSGLDRMIRDAGANKRQADALIAVYESARFELMGMFVQSQI